MWREVQVDAGVGVGAAHHLGVELVEVVAHVAQVQGAGVARALIVRQPRLGSHRIVHVRRTAGADHRRHVLRRDQKIDRRADEIRRQRQPQPVPDRVRPSLLAADLVGEVDLQLRLQAGAHGRKVHEARHRLGVAGAGGLHQPIDRVVGRAEVDAAAEDRQRHDPGQKSSHGRRSIEVARRRLTAAGRPRQRTPAPGETGPLYSPRSAPHDR